MRLAFFGPLPPSNTGIADYDAALLPLLREHYEVDIFTPENHRFFYSQHKQKRYDLNLYQMGNNPLYHEYQWAYAFEFPGATVFHDFCLHHSRAAMLLDGAHYEEYRDELAAVYPQQAEKLGNAVISFAGSNLLFFYFPFFELLLSSSLAAAAHTDVAVKQLQGTSTPVIKIPHLELPSKARVTSDLFPNRFVVGSFGFATRAKRIGSILNAVARIRDQHSEILYAIVGDVEQPLDLHSKIEFLHLQDFVHVTGHVSDQKFLEWMSRADVIVNLRYPSAGEMSGTLIRALASGTPVLISDISELREIPEEAVNRIRPTSEVDDLVESINQLIEDEPMRSRLAKGARDYIDAFHRPEQAVEKYRELIELALQRKPTFVPPELPEHLQPSKKFLHKYIQQTSFDDKTAILIDKIL